MPPPMQRRRRMRPKFSPRTLSNDGEKRRSHGTRRDKWRRITALQILTRRDHARSIELLARAVDGADADVATVALSLLGASQNPDAVDILFGALTRRRHPASR